jgi:hypothetical protein
LGGFYDFPISQSSGHALLAVVGAGYTYRSAGFSAAIPWSVSAKYIPGLSGILSNVSLLGNESLKTDTRTPPTSDFSTAGSVISGAVNPSLITIRGAIGYQFESATAVSVSYLQSISGSDAPKGYAIVLGARMSFESGGLPKPVAQVPPEDKVQLPPEPEIPAPPLPEAPALPIPEAPSPPIPDVVPQKTFGARSYSLEARVLRANDKMNMIKIDKGKEDHIKIGDIFDIFSVKADGSVIEVIARSKVKSVKSDAAVLNVTEHLKNILVQEDFVAKKLIQRPPGK